MRLCLLCSAILLSACTTPRASAVLAQPPVPPDLLRPCAGYTGILPTTEGAFAKAILAEAQGRSCANARLAALAKILKSDAPDAIGAGH